MLVSSGRLVKGVSTVLLRGCSEETAVNSSLEEQPDGARSNTQHNVAITWRIRLERIKRNMWLQRNDVEGVQTYSVVFSPRSGTDTIHEDRTPLKMDDDM